MLMNRGMTIKQLNELGRNPINPFNPNKNAIWQNFKTPKNKDFPFHRKSFFSELLFECGDFETYFNTIEEFSVQIYNWTSNRKRYWQRMYNVLCADYEPLWNYNRYDDDATNTNRKQKDNTKNKNDVAGYDSGDMVENYKTNGKLNEKFLQDWTRNNHSYGNIGVMSSQDLVKQELEICTYSMYKIIIDDFKEKYCLLIY